MANRLGVDPATTDRLYDEDEFEFLRAVHDFLKTSNRDYPTLAEILRIAKQLGYIKVEDPKS